MYRPGRLLDLCTEFLGPRAIRDPAAVAPRRGFPDRERIRVQRFVAGIRIRTLDGNGQPSGTPRVLKKLSDKGAADLKFKLREGGTATTRRLSIYYI